MESSALFLPPPRVPDTLMAPLPDGDLLDGLVPGGGQLVRDLLALRREVRDSIRDLEAGRPRGVVWRAALERDAAALVANKPPRSWAVAELLNTDGARWAAASAQARSATTRVQKLRDAAPIRQLSDAARAGWESLRHPLAQQAEAAWIAASSDDRGAGWIALGHVDSIIAEASALRGTLTWLEGQEYTAAAWPAPWTPTSRGWYLSATWLLQTEAQPMTLPEGVEWPAGSVGAKAARELATRTRDSRPAGAPPSADEVGPWEQPEQASQL